MNPKEAEELAAQLRSPHGAKAIEVGDFMARANRNLYQEFLKFFHPKSNQSILEIGPGNGKHISSILSCEKNLKYTAIDLSQEMIQAASILNKELISSNAVELVHGNCKKMDFKEASFDFVIGFNTIYFWDPLEIFIQEIKRVLKPSGQLFFAYRTKSTMLELPFAQHGFSLYEPSDLESIISLSGFKKIESRTFIEEIEAVDGQKLQLEGVFTLASSF